MGIACCHAPTRPVTVISLGTVGYRIVVHSLPQTTTVSKETRIIWCIIWGSNVQGPAVRCMHLPALFLYHQGAASELIPFCEGWAETTAHWSGRENSGFRGAWSVSKRKFNAVVKSTNIYLPSGHAHTSGIASTIQACGHRKLTLSAGLILHGLAAVLTGPIIFFPLFSYFLFINVLHDIIKTWNSARKKQKEK